LQSDRDLRKYRLPGLGRETYQTKTVGHAEKEETSLDTEPRINEGVEAETDKLIGSIRYALKVGPQYGTERLDLSDTLVITTYHTLRDYQFSLGLIDWSVVAFDEAQNIKNPNSMQTRAAKALKARFKLPLTGTPVENHLGDFWCLFDSFAPADSPGLLGTYQQFREQYVLPIVKAASDCKQETRTRIGKDLRDAVGGAMLRRTKEEHLRGLPKKRVILGEWTEGEKEYVFDSEILCEMPDCQRTMYDSVVNATVAALEDDGAKGAALSGLHRLRAVSLHPSLLDDAPASLPGSPAEARKIFGQSGKLLKLLSILEDVQSRDEKAIIFVITRQLQVLLTLGLSQIFGLNVEVVNGETKTVSTRTPNKTRRGIISTFEQSEGFNVVVMSPIAAGLGITVTSANNVIHLERHWNPAKEAQATDRVYRIGQTKDVNVYIPILVHPDRPSFDVNLHKLLASKYLLKDAVVVPETVQPEEFLREGVFGERVQSSSRVLSIDDVHSLHWNLFEAFIAELYRPDAEDVWLTPKGNDEKCDVVVFDGSTGSALVQCKKTSGVRKFDGIGAVHEIKFAKDVYQDKLGREFSNLVVFSNARDYSRQTKEAAKRHGVVLRGERDIRELQKRAKVTYEDILRRDNMRKGL